MFTSTVKKGDIFYADLSPVVGSEQGGIRPVLIVQNDVGNKFSPTVIAAAITSQKEKARLPTHIELKSNTSGLSRNSIVLLEQIRTIDKKRLKERMGLVDDAVMNKINEAIAISFGLSPEAPPKGKAWVLTRLPMKATNEQIMHSREATDSFVGTLDCDIVGRASVSAGHLGIGCSIFKEILEDVFNGKCNVFIVANHARLGQDAVPLAAFVKTLQDNSVKIYSTSNGKVDVS